jgi:hypothetical protein
MTSSEVPLSIGGKLADLHGKRGELSKFLAELAQWQTRLADKQTLVVQVSVNAMIHRS